MYLKLNKKRVKEFNVKAFENDNIRIRGTGFYFKLVNLQLYMFNFVLMLSEGKRVIKSISNGVWCKKLMEGGNWSRDQY